MHQKRSSFSFFNTKKIMARSSRLQAIEWLGFAGPGPRDSPELGISTRLHRPPCCQGSRWLGKAVFQVQPPWLCVQRGSRLVYRTGSGNSDFSRVSPVL